MFFLQNLLCNAENKNATIILRLFASLKRSSRKQKDLRRREPFAVIIGDSKSLVVKDK